MGHYFCSLKFVLPTNTTCTDAHAAVAAKISIGRAFVKIASTVENTNEQVGALIRAQPSFHDSTISYLSRDIAAVLCPGHFYFTHGSSAR